MVKKCSLFALLFFCMAPLFPEPYVFNNDRYYMLDYPVNIRSEPGTHGRILGKLQLHDQIEILECTYKEQIIDDIDAFWYKIQFKEITGYVWGGYIAIHGLAYDVDGNGIMDYFYYRISKVVHHSYVMDSYTDVVIYLNGEQLSTEAMTAYGRHHWGSCKISRRSNGVAFEMISVSIESDDYTHEVDTFFLNRQGNILFLGRRNIDWLDWEKYEKITDDDYSPPL